MASDLGKLFIGGISWDTDEERLKEYFSTYGEVVEAVIMRDRATGRARGFGFIVFTDPAVAQRVIMEKHTIDGRMVEAKKAVPRDDQNILTRTPTTIHGSPSNGIRTKKIFVGGLASTVTENDFKIYFDQFGTITDVVVMYDHNTQRPRGFGFITYDMEEAVERVLHKTFHELNGKMVEVKRAVPKEVFPGSRNPVFGYNYSVSRAANFLNNYAQTYNLSPVVGGGLGVRLDNRFGHLDSTRTGYTSFGSTGYGLGLNLDPSLNPVYGGSSNFGNGQRMLTPPPYYTGNSNRYNTPIGYNGGINGGIIGGNGRNDSVLSLNNRNVWGSGGGGGGGGLNSSANSTVLSANNRNVWDASAVLGQPGQLGMNGSGYSMGNVGYDNGDNNSYEIGVGGHGRNNGRVGGPITSFSSGYDDSLGDLYRNGSGYGDLTWRSSTPELDGSGSFSYGLGNVGPSKNSEGYVGSYDVTNRQPNRGIAA